MHFELAIFPFSIPNSTKDRGKRAPRGSTYFALKTFDLITLPIASPIDLNSSGVKTSDFALLHQ